jgi:hypothetical protein
MEPTQSTVYPLLSDTVHRALDTLPDHLHFDRSPLYVAGVGGEPFGRARVSSPRFNSRSQIVAPDRAC